MGFLLEKRNGHWQLVIPKTIELPLMETNKPGGWASTLSQSARSSSSPRSVAPFYITSVKSNVRGYGKSLRLNQTLHVMTPNSCWIPYEPIGGCSAGPL